MTPEHKNLVAARAEVDKAHARVSGDDGYNYAAGQEYGLRFALRILDKHLAAVESLSAQCAQPQAGEPIGYLVQGFDGGPFFATDREQYDRQGHAVVPVYASPQPANPAQVTDAMVETLAEFLCSEFDEDFNPCHGYSWPEHKDDDGYRGGNAYVKLQPSDVQARAREGATRILTFLSQRAALTATIGAGGQAVAADIGDAVLAWMVKYDLLDGDNEYQVADVMAVMDDLVPSSALSQPHPADERVVEALRAEIDRLRPHYQSQTATDAGRRQMLDHFERFAQDGRNG